MRSPSSSPGQSAPRWIDDAPVAGLSITDNVALAAMQGSLTFNHPLPIWQVRLLFILLTWAGGFTSFGCLHALAEWQIQPLHGAVDTRGVGRGHPRHSRRPCWIGVLASSFPARLNGIVWSCECRRRAIADQEVRHDSLGRAGSVLSPACVSMSGGLSANGRSSARFRTGLDTDRPACSENWATQGTIHEDREDLAVGAGSQRKAP